jgi:predicted molibdopterin-dependent oxidoreductase YjgC
VEPSVTIDGQAVSFTPGQTVLDVAGEHGIEIPTLCYFPEAGHRDVCRICVVEIEGAGRLMPACSTPAVDGMVIATATERVTESRRMTLQLLIGSGQHTCITCEALGDCRLSELAYQYGIEPPAEMSSDEFPRVEDEFVIRDYSKCILCGRCWAACTAIQVHGVVPHPSGRRAERGGGSKWYPLPDLDQCEFCGQCVDACPVGALSERRARGAARSWELERIRTTCPHCGMGCQTVVHVKAGEVVKVTAAGDAPPNRGRLCRRGRFAVAAPDEADRLTGPQLRRDGALVAATWDEALDAVAEGIRGVVERHGPGAVAGLFAPSRTNEDAYQAQKLFRAAIGTNSIDSRQADASRAPVADPRDAAEVCYEGGVLAVLEEARVILVVGDGDIDDYAVAGAALRGAVREGADLLVVDSGHNALGDGAATRVTVEPQAIKGVVNAIMGVLLADELAVRSEAGHALPHERDIESLLAATLPERVAEAAGVDAQTIRAVAAKLTAIRPAVVCSVLGPGDDAAGTSAAVVRLQSLLDDIAGARSVALPRGDGNAQGLIDMGVAPGVLPGEVRVDDDDGRRRWAAAWGLDDLPSAPGLATFEIIDGLTSGAVKAAWVGADDAGAFGPAPALLGALGTADLVIVQGASASALLDVAHVVLPSVTWGEDEGTFINAERRISRVRKVRTPPADVRPGWWIFREVARRLGHEWQAPFPRAIWEREIAALAPGLAAVSYDELERWGLCWHPVSVEASDEEVVA